MGTIKDIKKKMMYDVKVIDPTPVWEVTIQEEGKKPNILYMGPDKAQEYFQAGFPVKLKTSAGALRQND